MRALRPNLSFPAIRGVPSSRGRPEFRHLSFVKERGERSQISPPAGGATFRFLRHLPGFRAAQIFRKGQRTILEISPYRVTLWITAPLLLVFSLGF